MRRAIKNPLKLAAYYRALAQSVNNPELAASMFRIADECAQRAASIETRRQRRQVRRLQPADSE